MQITLPDELAKKLESRVAESQEFSSVDAYVCYVLEEVLKQTGGNNDAYTKEQEAEVKERLSNLGYLD
jgi:Arc/MetJ-type ribon-helix-helix transcriptional regulator